MTPTTDTSNDIERTIKTSASERTAALKEAREEFSRAVSFANSKFVEDAIQPALDDGMTIIDIAGCAKISRSRIHDMIRDTGGRR